MSVKLLRTDPRRKSASATMRHRDSACIPLWAKPKARGPQSREVVTECYWKPHGPRPKPITRHCYGSCILCGESQSMSVTVPRGNHRMSPGSQTQACDTSLDGSCVPLWGKLKRSATPNSRVSRTCGHIKGNNVV